MAYALIPALMYGFKENYLDSEFNDLLFEHRNKRYGAYELRKQYVTNYIRAFWIGLALFLLILCYPIYIEWFKQNKQTHLDIKDYDKIVEVNAFPSGAKIDIPAPPEVSPTEKKKTEDKQTKTVSKASIPIPSNSKELLEVKESNEHATETNISEENKQTGQNTGLDTNRLYKFSELDHLPQFNGNLQDFISRNLVYPLQATQKQIEGEVLVYFEVSKEGFVENVQIKKGLGYGCDQESKSVVMKMPRWTPGVFNKRPVRVSYFLPIAFKLR